MGQLPIELLRNITELVGDIHTLLALSCTSRYFRLEAERMLYRKVQIFDDKKGGATALVEMFERLMRCPRRLRHLLELQIEPAFEYVDLYSRTIQAMAPASSPTPFQHMTRLVSLRLDIDAAHLTSILNSLPPFVQLRSLLLYTHVNSQTRVFDPTPRKLNLVRFFETQNKLEEFGIIYGLLGPENCPLVGRLRALKTLITSTRCFPLLFPQPYIVRLSIKRVLGGLLRSQSQNLAGLQVLRLQYITAREFPVFDSCFTTLQYLEYKTDNIEGLAEQLRSMIYLQKLKLQIEETQSFSYRNITFDEMHRDSVAHITSMVPPLFTSCTSEVLAAIEVRMDSNKNLESTTWAFHDGLLQGRSTTWDEDEWKYDWPKRATGE